MKGRSIATCAGRAALRHRVWGRWGPGLFALAVFVGAMAASALLAPPRGPIVAGDMPDLLAWSALQPAAAPARPLSSGLDLPNLQDADPRAERLLRSMREASDRAPAVAELDGREVGLMGYVVPLDGAASSTFLLVPYFGACIHTPPPPANQVVHVIGSGALNLRTMDRVVVRGRIRVVRSAFEEASSGY
ncbi:MAG TPA: DUF3299 domain-containing protein, partial [Ramlibacter sp.]|nr:DUF3299 domain-containing protein [Ramlibacter sp.]